MNGWQHRRGATQFPSNLAIGPITLTLRAEYRRLRLDFLALSGQRPRLAPNAEGHGLIFCGGLGGAGDAVEPDCSSLGSTRRHGPVAISGLILSKALHEFSVSSQS